MRSHFIKEWRKARGLTQKQLADGMGISQSYVTMVERGDRRYDQHFLEGAAKVLDCSVADLIARPPGQTASIDAILLNMSGPDRERVEVMVRAMLAAVTSAAAPTEL